MTFRERSFRGRFSVESLCDVLESEVRKKSTVGIDRVTVKSFARDLRGNVEIISRKVLEGSYHFTNYSQMLVPKAPGAVPRELCIPTVRDKVTLKALSHVLDDAFGSLAATAQPQRTVDAIKECLLSGQYDAFFKWRAAACGCVRASFPFPQRFDLRDALVAAKLVFVRLLATDLSSVVGADLIVGRQCPTVDPQ